MIQNYIDKRKEEIALEHEREKHQLLENLSIGNKIYSDSNKRTLEFPLYYEYDLYFLSDPHTLDFVYPHFYCYFARFLYLPCLPVLSAPLLPSATVDSDLYISGEY